MCLGVYEWPSDLLDWFILLSILPDPAVVLQQGGLLLGVLNGLAGTGGLG